MNNNIFLLVTWGLKSTKLGIFEKGAFGSFRSVSPKYFLNGSIGISRWVFSIVVAHSWRMFVQQNCMFNVIGQFCFSYFDWGHSSLNRRVSCHVKTNIVDGSRYKAMELLMLRNEITWVFGILAVLRNSKYYRFIFNHFGCSYLLWKSAGHCHVMHVDFIVVVDWLSGWRLLQNRGPHISGYLRRSWWLMARSISSLPAARPTTVRIVSVSKTHHHLVVLPTSVDFRFQMWEVKVCADSFIPVVRKWLVDHRQRCRCMEISRLSYMI